MNTKEFFTQADKVVQEFCDFIQGDEDTRLPSDPVRSSPIFQAEELAKHHRKIWLNWARGKRADGENVPAGWLVEYDRQAEGHKEVQRLQAEALFALGYQAALEDMRGQTAESREKTAKVKPTKRSTVQVFTTAESRLLIASLMAFVSYTLKKKGVAIEPATVRRLQGKLAVLADLNMDHVDYLPLKTANIASGVKPKWKATKRSVKPTKPSRSMSDFVKRK